MLSTQKSQTTKPSQPMNNTGVHFPAESPGFANETYHPSSGYRIGVTVGVLILTVAAAIVAFLMVTAILVALVSYFTGLQTPTFLIRPAIAAEERATTEGIDEAVLASFPKIVYKKQNDDGGSGEICCSICLAEYKDDEVLRQLPECGHRFHLDCVDLWLRSHATCPVCRQRSPALSPFADVTPTDQRQMTELLV